MRSDEAMLKLPNKIPEVAMVKQKNEIITVQGISVSIVKHNEEDYISLTDIAGYRDTERNSIVIQN